MSAPSFHRVVVRSSLDDFEDVVLEQLHPTTTIKHVKKLLTRAHPLSPEERFQKLIYSGRQLSDEDVLEHTLRKDTEHHIMHLVITKQMQSSAASPVATSSSHTSLPPTPSTPTTPQSQEIRQRFSTNSGPTPFRTASAPAPSGSHITPSSPYYAYYYAYYTQQHRFSQHASPIASPLPASGSIPASPMAAPGSAAHTPAPAVAATDAHVAEAAPQQIAAPQIGDDLAGNRFAQAGLGAAPIVDNEDPERFAENNQFGVMHYIWMVARLVIFVALFGQDTSPTKFYLLIALMVAVFLIQSGIIPLGRPAAPAPAPAQPAEGQEQGSDAEQEPAVEAPPSPLFLMWEIVYTFISCMIPAVGEVPA